MLERVIVKGVGVYRSPLLFERGVTHGFSTRLGGISSAPFDSMNLGNPAGCPVQDPPDHIEANFKLLAEAVGCVEKQWRAIRQVHGSGVVEALADREPSPCDGDALITADARCAVYVRVADCVPVLLAGKDGRLVAAIHAGWRGVVGGVVPAAVSRLRELDGTELTAAIGPCIGVDAFEVGPEVLAEFTRCFGADAPIRSGASGKGTVDLREAVRLQLIDAGVDGDRIDTTDRCTFRDRMEFFSHRRDAGVTGRMVAVISPRDRRA